MMDPMNDTSKVESLLSTLRLKHFATQYTSDLQELPPGEQELITRHLLRWSEKELAERRAGLIQGKVRSAKFRKIQTIDAFDFTHSKSVQEIQKKYMTLYNSISAKCLPNAIFSGTAGLGKTHMARALGYAACQKGLSSLFVTAAEMVNNLNNAQKFYTLENELRKYRRPQVLIIDELGYVAMDAQASNLFFQVISARHDADLGTIATTNLPFGKFNQIFANDAIAHAIVDRLVNTAEVFYLEGVSYREKQRQNKSKAV